MISCDDILFFTEVVKAGSFSKAATILNTTQATISRRIQSLEEDVQQQLLVRNPRGFTLSQAGEELYGRFKEWGNDLRNTLSEIISTKEELKGVLKVAIFSAFMHKVLLPHIHKFTYKHPQVKIIVRVINKSVDLLRDNFDLVISPMLPSSEVAKVKVVFKTQLKLYCSPDYIKTYGQPQTVEELSKHHLLKLFAETGTSVEYYLAKHENQPNLDQLIAFPGSLYIRDTIFSSFVTMAGHYISLGIPELLHEEVVAGKMVEILPEYSFSDLSLYLIRYGAVNNPAEREFVRFIEIIIKNWQQHLESESA